jgi:hypothetical protein
MDLEGCVRIHILRLKLVYWIVKKPYTKVSFCGRIYSFTNLVLYHYTIKSGSVVNEVRALEQNYYWIYFDYRRGVNVYSTKDGRESIQMNIS